MKNKKAAGENRRFFILRDHDISIEVSTSIFYSTNSLNLNFIFELFNGEQLKIQINHAVNRYLYHSKFARCLACFKLKHFGKVLEVLKSNHVSDLG